MCTKDISFHTNEVYKIWLANTALHTYFKLNEENAIFLITLLHAFISTVHTVSCIALQCGYESKFWNE